CGGADDTGEDPTSDTGEDSTAAEGGQDAPAESGTDPGSASPSDDAGTGAESPSESSSDADDAALPDGISGAELPIEIEHAFGTTVIEEVPERVASVNWANHEVPLALGVVPVGMAAANFGDDDGNGLLPWVEEELAELGG